MIQIFANRARSMESLLRTALAILLLLSTLWFALTPAIAYAQAAAPNATAPAGAFTVRPDDYFVNYLLKGMLGDTININSSEAQGMVTGKGTMGEMFRAFNLGVAFFGSVIIMFVAVVGVLNTGQDGEFLGKRWSSFWVPLRFAGGAALMLPISNSGYSFVQAMCLWIAGQGIGFADSVWDAIVDTHMPKAGSTIVAQVSTSSIVSNIFGSEVCTAYINSRTAGTINPDVKYNWFIDDKTSSGGLVTYKGVWWKPTLESNVGASSSGSMVYDSARVARGQVCGALTYSYKADKQNPTTDYAVLIGKVHMDQATQMRPSLSNLAKDYVAALNTDTDGSKVADVEIKIKKAIEQYSDSYKNALIAAADTQISGSPLGTMKKMQETMKKMGFAVAGGFYMELVKTQNSVRAGLQATPGYQGPSYDVIGKDYGSENWLVVKRALDTVTMNAAMDISEKNMDGSVEAGGAQGVAGTDNLTKVKTIDLDKKMFETTDLSNGIDGWSQKMALAIMQAVIQVGKTNQQNSDANLVNSNGQFNNFSLTNSKTTNTSVILQLKNKGDTILNIAGITYASYVVATGAVKWGSSNIVGRIADFVTGAGSAWSTVLETIGLMIFSMVMGLITLGVMLAVVIPMTPFMIWVMGIMGILVLIFEALVASVIWAVMIMHPSGEGVTSDHSRQGLMILLMVFMRPTLMLIGMEAGIFMVEPMVAFVNDMFGFVFHSTQEGTVSGLFIVFGICSIYTTLILAVIRKSFSMIHVIPDRVLMWIGGGPSQLGESEIGDRGDSLAGSAGQRVSNISGGLKPNLAQQQKFGKAMEVSGERKDRANADKKAHEAMGALPKITG